VGQAGPLVNFKNDRFLLLQLHEVIDAKAALTDRTQDRLHSAVFGSEALLSQRFG
jgi:hypothetical protein